jgi:hypothetical protein
MRHVNAGVTCQTCHGKIQEMPQVYQYSSLNMGWCVSCHVNGYSPQEGDVAAGYGRVETGGVTPAGEPLQTVTAPTSANAQQQPPSSTVAAGRQPARSAAGRTIARYDCANCHY